MNSERSGDFGVSVLGALGIDDVEEQVYSVLLSFHTATAEEIANALTITPRRAQQLLERVEAKGLATHSPERPRRYIASPPELAIEALASQRQAAITRARASIPQFKEKAVGHKGGDARTGLVELITSRAALGQVLTQIRQMDPSEIIVFQRAPILYAGETTENSTNEPVGKAPMKGVIRNVTDAGFLALPTGLARIRRDIEAGENVRVFPVLPVKMLVADRSLGLIPLNPSDENGPVLLVRASSLLDALYALFELIWEASTPITFTGEGDVKMGVRKPNMHGLIDQLVPLLAAGLNDKAVAHEAGMSSATLNRRVGELMKSFGTRTRFQLGWRAALEAFPERLDTKKQTHKNPAVQTAMDLADR